MRDRWTLTEMKEIVLSILALIWGILFLLPGDTLGRATEIYLLSAYASDWFWGIILVLTSLFLLFSSRKKYFLLRKLCHALLWLFWLGMAILVLLRLTGNGIQVVDFLLCSPFMAIAFIHAAFYARLVYVK